MTPQVSGPYGKGRGASRGRFSVGLPPVEIERDEGAFGGARRVRRESAWKVRDIVVPVKDHHDEEEQDVVEEVEEQEELEERDITMEMTSPMKAARTRLSEEERKVGAPCKLTNLVSAF